ncbi:hypothetical protein QE152_g8650 [Popillia japonica]|uniref:Uncharacterized protein n=2 Tax=Popillia japonica TaxID=7064 RepID=A0AAW1LXF5_POPJA
MTIIIRITSSIVKLEILIKIFWTKLMQNLRGTCAPTYDTKYVHFQKVILEAVKSISPASYTDTTSHNTDKNSVGKANFVGPSTSSSIPPDSPDANSDEDKIFIQNEPFSAPVSPENLLLPSDPGIWNLQKMTDKCAKLSWRRGRYK